MCQPPLKKTAGARASARKETNGGVLSWKPKKDTKEGCVCRRKSGNRKEKRKCKGRGMDLYVTLRALQCSTKLQYNASEPNEPQ